MVGVIHYFGQVGDRENHLMAGGLAAAIIDEAFQDELRARYQRVHRRVAGGGQDVGGRKSLGIERWGDVTLRGSDEGGCSRGTRQGRRLPDAGAWKAGDYQEQRQCDKAAQQGRSDMRMAEHTSLLRE